MTKNISTLKHESGHYQHLVRAVQKQRAEALTSIIILTHNQLHHTKLCLESIESHTPQPHELIIVDNASTDGTLEYLRWYSALCNNVRIIANSENLGFSAGNNQGLAVAGGNYVVLLNNDTVMTQGWLKRMLAVFKRYPAVGIVGPVSNNVAGLQQVRQAAYHNLAEMHQFANRWAAAHAGQSTEFFKVIGFCLMARKAVIDQIGGLDEQFGAGNFEDDDFCVRAASAGFKSRIAKDVFIHHTGGQTFKGANINYKQSLEKNWGLFKAKWNIPAALPYGDVYKIDLTTVEPSSVFSPLPLAAGVEQYELTEDEDSDYNDSITFQQAAKQILASGQAAVMQGDFETAVTEFTRITRQYPDLAAGQTALGGTLLALDRAAEAVPALRRASELVPQEKASHNQLGIAFFRLGQWNEAETAFQRARQIDPTFLDPLINMIDLYRTQQRYQEALDAITEGLSVDAEHIDIWVAFGLISHQLEHAEGVQTARQQLKDAPSNHLGVQEFCRTVETNLDRPRSAK